MQSEVDRSEPPAAGAEAGMRQRILAAAFAAFMDNGFERASTLDIATRAKVSKRELYRWFDDKQAMLAACIEERTQRMRRPFDLPAAADRASLAAQLTAIGQSMLDGVCTPQVLAVHRLAIAESDRSPAIALKLDEAGRAANRAALASLLTAAQARGWLGPGDAEAMAARFFALLWGDLLIRLLLRVSAIPNAEALAQRAREATAAFLALYPAPEGNIGA